MEQKNNFKHTNFHGSTQIGSGNTIYHYYSSSGNNGKKLNLNYSIDPVWRSPVTMGILSWIGFVSSIITIGVFIFPAIVEFKDWVLIISIAIISIFVSLFCFYFRNIAKKQLRVAIPYLTNYAFNGLGGEITIEKITPPKCPVCGGDMKYYDQDTKWINQYYSNGSEKQQVIKRQPALECKRNPEHFFLIDPAEQRINKINNE